MTGTHQSDEFTDSQVETRLLDYGARWRAATAQLDHSDHLTGTTGRTGRTDTVTARRATAVTGRHHSPWLVTTGVAAAVVGVVLAATLGLSHLSSPSTSSSSPAPAPAPSQPGEGWAPGDSTKTPSTATTAADTSSGPGVTFAGPIRIAAPTEVRVSASGFTPYASVAVAVCPAARPQPKAAGDCGRSTNKAARLVTVGADGTATTTITISPGPLENQAPPAERCGLSSPCVVNATDIHDTNASASAPIRFSTD